MSKKQLLSRWDKNLEYLIKAGMEGRFNKKDVPRHAHDFLESYREVLVQIISKDLLKK